MYQVVKKVLNSAGIDVNRIAPNQVNYWPRNTPEKIVFYELDDQFHTNYEKAQVSTQMDLSDNAYRRQRHYTLVQLFRNTLEIPGQVAECGTFHGLSAYQISKIIKESQMDKRFHIFDSFEGLSEIKEEDRSDDVKVSDSELRTQFAYGIDLVRKNLEGFDFVELFKGWIPERFQEVAEHEYSFVHVDVDLYEPIKECIDFFFPRLSKGGIMVFDDYGFSPQFPGAKKAVDEFLNKNEVSHFISLPSGQAYIIK